MLANILKKSALSAKINQNSSKIRSSILQGYLPMASFAKFDRTLPHLNVGTIGKY